jgi:hypothetical protein
MFVTANLHHQLLMVIQILMELMHVLLVNIVKKELQMVLSVLWDCIHSK